MRSMTGYGKGIAERDERKATVELKSVNHRFLDILMKFPRGFASAEDGVKKVLQTELSRGHVDVFMTYEDKRAEKDEIKIDAALAKRYFEAAKTLEADGIVNDLGAANLLRMPDVVSVTPLDDDEELRNALVKEAAAEALKNLVIMRDREGEALKKDLNLKIDELYRLSDAVKSRAPEVQKEYRAKLENRMKDALANMEIDEGKLLNEVAFFADKANVDEETVRFRGHLDHFKEILEKEGSVGKQLDFLVQEMNREVNTTGSKASDLSLTETVLQMKNVVEMLREQIQNLE